MPQMSTDSTVDVTISFDHNQTLLGRRCVTWCHLLSKVRPRFAGHQGVPNRRYQCNWDEERTHDIGRQEPGGFECDGDALTRKIKKMVGNRLKLEFDHLVFASYYHIAWRRSKSPSLNGPISTVSEVVMITGDNKITAEPQRRAETCG